MTRSLARIAQRVLQLPLFPLHSDEPPGPRPEVPPRLATRVDADAAQRLSDELARRLDHRLVSLAFTDARSVVVSVRERARFGRRSGLVLRLHVELVKASEATLDAVAAFATGRGRARVAASATLRTWARETTVASAPTTTRTVPLRPTGQVHDLAALRDQIAAEHFPDLAAVAITWGRAGLRRRRAGGRIRLGSWDARRRLVRIHPVLDQEWVPSWVIGTIVHHELAHAAEPPREGRGRRAIHHAAFRAREAEHPRHADAASWITIHIDRLLRERPRAERRRRV